MLLDLLTVPTLLNVTLSPHSSWTCVPVIEAANGPQQSMDGSCKTYLVKKSRFLVCCEVWYTWLPGHRLVQPSISLMIFKTLHYNSRQNVV